MPENIGESHGEDHLTGKISRVNYETWKRHGFPRKSFIHDGFTVYSVPEAN